MRVCVNGRDSLRLLPELFKFERYFDGLEYNQILQAIEDVHTMFYGAIETGWGIMEEPIRSEKRMLCWQYLTAWKLANDYPDSLIGMIANPLMPISEKHMKTLTLKYNNYTKQAGGLEILQNNPFGMQALAMIQSMPELYMWGSNL